MLSYKSTTNTPHTHNGLLYTESRILHLHTMPPLPAQQRCRIHTVTPFTFTNTNATIVTHNDDLYTHWRRLHTMTLLHLHITPLYTHKTTTPYTHNDVIIHTAAPLTFSPKCRLGHAPQNVVHTHNSDLYIWWHLLYLQTTPPCPKTARPHTKTNCKYTNAFYPYTHRRLILVLHRRLIHNNDACYPQRHPAWVIAIAYCIAYMDIQCLSYSVVKIMLPGNMIT